MRNATSKNIAVAATKDILSLSAQIEIIKKPSGSVAWEGLYTPSLTTQKVVQLQLDGISIESSMKVPRENIEI